MIESMLWMLRGIAELRRFFWAPETGVKIEVGGWDSFFSLPYSKWKEMSWMLKRAISLEMVLLSIKDKINVK